MAIWRVGNKIKLNVYDGDRPVCQCHNEEDATMIVLAMNTIHPKDAKCLVWISSSNDSDGVWQGGYCALPLGHEGKHMYGTGD